MAGLFATLDTATRALQVNQLGLAVAGHNIANVSTPGYTRQRQVLQAAVAGAGGSGNVGRGVEQQTIERIRDDFLQQRLVQESANRGKFEVRANLLSQIENIFNEQGSQGLGFQLSAFLNSFDGLENASTPGAAGERNSVIAAAQTLVDTFHQLDSQLRDLQQSADRTLVALLPQINSAVRRIAELNGEIQALEVRSPANDLRDAQEQALRELAGLVEVSSFRDSRGGLVVLLEGGLPLVDGSTVYELRSTTAAVPNPFDPTFSDISVVGGGVSFNATSSITGGELGGLLYGRDVATSDAIRELDAFTATVVDAVNTVHNLGLGLLDETNRDFFLALTELEGAAAAISINSELVEAPDHIAAGLVPDSGPGPADEGDNRNAQALADLRGTAVPTFQKSDSLGPPPTPTGGNRVLTASLASIVGGHGQAALVSDQARDQQENILAAVQAQRDNVSAVSIDEEVTDLVRLQAAYQANARVIAVINQVLQELVDIL